MKIKAFLFVLAVFLVFGCDTGSSSGGSSGNSSDPADEFWGYAENGDLNLEIEQEFDTNYYFSLSQNGTVYVTIDGSEPTESNYEYVFTYDYFEGVSSRYCKVTLGDGWEFTIRALGIADAYPVTNEEGTTLVYDSPQAPEGTTVTFSKSIRFEERSIPSSSSPGETYYSPIPAWGTASCTGAWTYILGGVVRYYLMEAGSSGIIRYTGETNTGSFLVKYADGTTLQDGDTITEGTRFYLYARQGDYYSDDYLTTRYSFDFWVEE